MPMRCWFFILALCVTFDVSPSFAQAKPAPTITRDAVKQAVEQLEQLTVETQRAMRLPGIAIVVVHQDEVVYLKGFGVRETGKPAAIDADTVFQLASVSKPLTATILAKLVGEGRLHWDDRVSDHDPTFQMYDAWVTRELTLRDLLCHRSGLPDHAGDLLEDLGYPREDVLRRLRFLPPAYSFRSGNAYTNFGFSQAAYAAARSENQTWEDLADREFFQPLGMTSTSFRHADFLKHENRARLHVRAGDGWQAKFDRQPDGQAPAGGASSNLRDLAIWLRLLLKEGQHAGQSFVSASALEETHQPQASMQVDPATGRFSSYGLGWNIGVERGQRITWKHSGAFALGARTEISLLPAEQLAIGILSNASPTGVPEGLSESFFDFVLNGKQQRNWVEFANAIFDQMDREERSKIADYSHPPASPEPALPLARYAGEYDQEFFGRASVVVRGDALELQLGPERQAFPLTHWNRDRFTYLPPGENSPGLCGVQFVLSSEGRATHLEIENLQHKGLGSFRKVSDLADQHERRQ